MNATQLYLRRVSRYDKNARGLYANFGYSAQLVEEGWIEISFNISNGLQI